MIQSVIFDLDGTVLDNEQIWEEAFRQVAKKFSITNFQFTNNDWIHEPGVGVLTNWKRIAPERADELARETVRQFKILNAFEVRPGLVEFVESVRERGWLTGLATSTEWLVVEEELEQLQLYLAFDVTTTGEEVLAPKPDPEIYLLTAQKLGVEPEECLVVEDSVAGVRAGVEAGCSVVALESGYAPKKLLLAAGAKWTVNGFGECIDILNIL